MLPAHLCNVRSSICDAKKAILQCRNQRTLQARAAPRDCQSVPKGLQMSCVLSHPARMPESCHVVDHARLQDAAALLLALASSAQAGCEASAGVTLSGS